MTSSHAKLALVELLLGADDVPACGRAGLGWLSRHVGTARALLLASARDPRRLVGVAGLGISKARTGKYAIDLADRHHPLVKAARAARPTHFPTGRHQPETPLEGVPFYALPIRARPRGAPLGLMLVQHDAATIHPHLVWLTEVLGRTLARLDAAVVSVLRNATDLRRARRALEENHRRLGATEASMRTVRQRLDLVVDAVVDPIVQTDSGGVMMTINAPAERFFTSAVASGRAARRHVRRNVAQFSSFVSTVLGAGAERRAVAHLALTDPASGRPVPMEVIAEVMPGARAEDAGVVTVLHDQTEALERERLYCELREASALLEQKVREATTELAMQNELLRRQALDLEQASAAKSQFLANVSHEFRTPLNAILGYATMLLGGFYGGLTFDQQKTVARIDANSRHLARLINDVLDIERIEAGKMPLDISSFGLDDVLRELMEELEGVIAQSPIRVDVTLPENLSVRVRSDRQKVKQILVNLLSNALKFTKQGRIAIGGRTDPARGRFSVAVADTGVGIAATDFSRIFEPFQQAADRAASRALGGTGLGLAICRRLAHVLGGEIHVDSHLGVGSTFTVDLPLRARPRTAARRPQTGPHRRSA